MFPIPLPPMRERREYIPLLVRNWPGNVPELENLIERAVIRTRGSALSCAAYSCRGGLAAAAQIHTQRESQWVVGGSAGAAARLGMKRTTLQSRMQKLGSRATFGRRGRRPQDWSPAHYFFSIQLIQ